MKQSEALKVLGHKVAACEKCSELFEYRKACEYKTVLGAGNPNAEIMFVGEAPGQNEAEQGEPFVGKAGNLLTNIIKSALNMTREEVYIANILKCRPPNNRDPLPEEAKNCQAFLSLQIKVIQPKWIVCLGKYASHYMLKKDPSTSMGSMRGLHEIEGRKVICTYHPSYLLRNPSAKSQVAEDLFPLISDLRIRNMLVKSE